MGQFRAWRGRGGGPRAPRPLRAGQGRGALLGRGGLPSRGPCFALVLFKRRAGSSSKVANTVGGFEVRQILNESKVFFSRTSFNN